MRATKNHRKCTQQKATVNVRGENPRQIFTAKQLVFFQLVKET